MAEIKIAGIMRSASFSPNHIGNDAAILNLVADQLRKRGCTVNIYSEEQFLQGAAQDCRILVNMCREPRSIALLQQREDAGDLVINSGYGIENCTRERMTRILIGSGIPFPESVAVNTDETVRDSLAAGYGACWVKRGDMHTMHREDVSYARHLQEAQEILQEYFLRGMKRAVISRHLEGELVKFYGVIGTPFFHWYFHFDSARSKHGPGPATAPRRELPPVDAAAFRSVCERAAEALDVRVYGGDAIVAPDGSFKLIDLNDWPSFAPCRNEAAPVIARMIMQEIKKHNAL